MCRTLLHLATKMGWRRTKFKNSLKFNTLSTKIYNNLNYKSKRNLTVQALQVNYNHIVSTIHKSHIPYNLAYKDLYVTIIYTEDITRWCADMDFSFEWWKQYFMNEQSEWVNCFLHEKIKSISSNHRVISFYYIDSMQKAVIYDIDRYLH